MRRKYQKVSATMGARSYMQKALAEPRTLAFWRDLLAEMVASFVLMSAQSAVPLGWGGHRTETGTAIQIALGMGFVVTTMAWTFGDFGGAHMNPAVTVAMMLSARVSFIRGLLYIVVQCAGCIAGTYFISAVTPEEFHQGLAATQLGKGMQPWQGYLVEMWITTILVFTIYGSTNQRRKGNLFMFSIPIGMAVSLGIMVSIAHTGGSMNPARSLGPAVVMGLWTNHWVYWAGPISGGVLATVLYVGMFDRVDRPKAPESDIITMVSVDDKKMQEADSEMVIRI